MSSRLRHGRSGRRAAAALLAAALAGPLAAPVWAQAYPTRPIRYIIPSSAGSGNDFIARIMAADVGQTLGQQIVVDNRAGAAGNIAAELAANAVPDGHTIFQTSITLAINATFYPKLPYSLVRDFAPVTLLAIQTNLVTVHASLPAKSVSELVGLARAKPGTIHYSSSGLGGNSFLAAEYLAALTGVRFVHVAYKGGGPAILALAAGETSLMIGPIPTAMPHIQQGKLRGLAVTHGKRLPEFPQFPTVNETVPGYEFDNWYGLMVPVRTPARAAALLHRATVDALRKPAIVAQLGKVGYLSAPNEPPEFGAFLKAEIAKVAQIIKQTGAKAE